jgi:glycosyltransferase involved in cell wall biosynthesis
MGGARYSNPLDATAEKKFRGITSLAEIFVIGFSRGVQWQRFRAHAMFYLLPQLPIPALRYLELLVVGQFLMLWLIVRHRIQVVVTQSPYEGFVAALAIKFAAWLGYHVRLVVEVHGDFERSPFWYREIRFPDLYRFLMNRLARFSIRHADALRAVSNSTREQLMQWVPQTAIVQFPAWTDIDTFLQAGRTKHESTQSVIYVGVVNPLKGIHYLIKAFSLVAGQFPSAQLVIIGNHDNKSYVGDLLEQVKSLGLADRATMVGPMPQSELAVRMSMASVLVLPSVSEGLPRVIIEAMATATPVVASRVGGIPELIEDGITGFLVPPGDETALAAKLHWALKDPVRARAMGAAARSVAERLFSTERYLMGYKQIFALVRANVKRSEHATSSV